MHIDNDAFAADATAASTTAGGLPTIASHHPDWFVRLVGDRTSAGV